MYAFVKGTDKAVPFYQKAFDTTIEYEDVDLKEDGTYWHVLLKFNNQMLGLSELSEDNMDSVGSEKITGNVMQFCLLFDADEEDKLRNAYEVLKEDADVRTPLGPMEYAYLICDLIDKYGIRWCMAIENKNK